MNRMEFVNAIIPSQVLIVTPVHMAMSLIKVHKNAKVLLNAKVMEVKLIATLMVCASKMLRQDKPSVSVTLALQLMV